MSLRPGRRRVALWGALGLLLVVTGALAFDEVWMRPLLQRYVRSHAGRRIDFDTLHLGLDRALQPTIGFGNLTIENAAWASSHDPLVRATRFVATFTWSSLWRRPILISRMTLDDADLDLEIQADGLRNWRLTQPEYRGPGQVRVQTLDAQRVRARYVHGGLGLEMTAQIGPRSSAAPAAGASAPLANQPVAIHGARHGTAFEAQLAVGGVPTFYDTGDWFALQGTLKTAQARLAAQGRVHDLIQLGGLEGAVQAEGAQLGELAAVFGRGALNLPPQPGRVVMQLSKAGDHWHLGDLAAHLADSDVAGTLDYGSGKSDGSRPTLRASFTSERIDLAPWRAHRLPSAAPAASAGGLATAPDTALDWRIASVQGLPLKVGDVHLVLNARAGTWRADPLVATVAGGHVAGTGAYDASAQPPRASADLRITGLALDRVGPRKLTGQLDLEAALTMQGDSTAALLASTDGTLEAQLHHASLPAALEAKLGLDGGRWLRAVVADEARVPVTCSTLAMRFDRGIGTVRRFGLETANVRLDGTGRVDLPARSLDLTLTPQRKHSALFALDRSVRVSGTFGELHTALVETPEAMPRGACQGNATP